MKRTKLTILSIAAISALTMGFTMSPADARPPSKTIGGHTAYKAKQVRAAEYQAQRRAESAVPGLTVAQSKEDAHRHHLRRYFKQKRGGGFYRP